MSEYIKKGETWEGIPDYSNNFRKDIFHVVDHIPANYQVWNIPITAYGGFPAVMHQRW